MRVCEEDRIKALIDWCQESRKKNERVNGMSEKFREECVRKLIEYHVRRGRRKLLKFLLKYFSGFIPKERIVEIYEKTLKEFPTLDTFLS